MATQAKLLLKYVEARHRLLQIELLLYPEIVLWGASYFDWPEWRDAWRTLERRKRRLQRWNAKHINQGAGI